MTHDFVGWTPPPGVVVDPPCHEKTTVRGMYSDGSFDYVSRPAAEINWSSVGDGPRVVAYAVVEEYKPKPVLRERWLVGHVAKESEADAARFLQELQHDHPGLFDNRPIIHVREVPDPSREVVAWAVVDDECAELFRHLDDANDAQEIHGGTVVRLSGVMPNE